MVRAFLTTVEDAQIMVSFCHRNNSESDLSERAVRVRAERSGGSAGQTRRDAGEPGGDLLEEGSGSVQSNHRCVLYAGQFLS